MSTCTYNCFMNVINIGNSIIGVSILAMPYCFRKCGILLSVILIFISGILTRTACYLLLKSAIMARRRNFEFLAFHTFGTTGKLTVEISVIGFLIGVCIAFFVVIGDLGPPLAAEFLFIENSPNLRTNLLIMVGLCVALPLGMLRKIDSLTSFSALSIAFYACLILKIFAEAVPNLAANEWWNEVNWWRSEGMLPCLPIFSMALSCQTQLFEFFDTSTDPSLKRMQSVIAGAVHLCSAVYIMVGTLGYIAFHDKAIAGNILVFLSPSIGTEVIKLGFILTIAISFPLCLFPCRSSLHSLIFKQGFGHHELTITAIPELRFRILTVSLITVTIGIAIMVPNIEFVLGLIGSTIGTLICLILPALMFIHDTSKNTAEKRIAQILVGIGFFILIACTYSTLQEAGTQPEPILDKVQNIKKISDSKIMASSIAIEIISPEIIPSSPSAKEKEKPLEKEKEDKPPDNGILVEQKRLEPPVPQEPEIKVDQNADLDPLALQKEDKEIQKETIPSSSSLDISKKEKNIDKQENILRKLEEQHKEQKFILEQQKKVLEELKLHKESHEERKKAMEEQAALIPEVKRVENIPPQVKRVENIPPQVKRVENLPPQFNQLEKELVTKSSNILISKLPLKILSKPNAIPDNHFKREENKLVPILNGTRDSPPKNNVLIIENNIPKNYLAQVNAKVVNQQQQFTQNETLLNFNSIKTAPEAIVQKPISVLPTAASNGVSSLAKAAISEVAKVIVDDQAEGKISDTHIIQRETLGKEDEPSETHISMKDKDVGMQKLLMNDAKAPISL